MPSLDKYKKKRDFSQTSEPEEGGARKTKKLRFVVQRHHASRLHYDFRLEMDGLLKSWAIPKGPSLNPKDKRLAVMVEDHPLSYRSFEGEIPKGNYGFGTVNIFDEGYYTPLENGESEKHLLEALEEGSLKIVLHGKKLKGEFALVKIKNAQEEQAWLLIKHRDKYAVDGAYDTEEHVSKKVKDDGIAFRKEEKRGDAKSQNDKRKHHHEETKKTSSKADVLMPMLAVLAEQLPDDGDWIFEQKLDGFRALAQINGKKIQLFSRNGINLNSKFPSVVDAFTDLERDMILDGEIVAEDLTGKSNFQLLQHGEPLPASYRLRYHLFDMLMLDGNDLRDFPVLERKDLLKRFLKKLSSKKVVFVREWKGELAAALAIAKKKKWEGIIAKEAESRYLSGKRSSLWRKIKLQQSQEAIIVGYTEPSGSRVGFGALVLAVQGDETLTYIGNVGSGFSDDQLSGLTRQLKKSITKHKPFDRATEVANEQKVMWVKPGLIAEVVFSEWTADGHLRHPVFKSLRHDKKLEDIKKVVPIKDVLNERERKFGRKILQLSNQKKLYWPKDGITKGDLIDFYEQVSSFMLPYLNDKPISLNRYPNGIEEAGFFQKDIDRKGSPTWLKTVELTSESTGDTVNYLLCNDLPTLLWIANMGSIEINPWLATYRKKNNPVFAVLDIDPNGVDFKEVVAVANTAKEVLDHAEVKSYIKTSGSTGLHIYLHLGGQYNFDVARDFVQMLAELVHEQHLETTSLERSPTKRKNKIYLDYMQNKRAQTIVVPYSVRPKPLATVSTPLDWAEVNDDLSIQQFTMSTVLKRIHTLPDPWRTIFDEKVNLKKAIASF